MSLITNPRHTVEVINTIATQNDMGTTDYIRTDPTSIRCNVHPVSANEAEQYGLVLTDSYRITAPAGIWPGEPNSLIRWNGLEFVQVGRARLSRMGRRTQADRIFMKRGQTEYGSGE